MSIRIAKAAFARGLGDAGQVTSCAMGYARAGNTQMERYFIIYRKDGETNELTVDVQFPESYEAKLFEAGQTAAEGE
jgi:hypothetical protein